MLPARQFRGCPRCNTTNAVHMVVSRIKDAWCSGHIAAALFLDVQGAFPNTVGDRLIHNMCKCGVPNCYVRLT
ncbi:hypothetical protein J132_07209 [Termitomyces sp. J132]|nr:hypothetical protein J132_07209 [Termitomyces sp. J132]